MHNATQPNPACPACRGGACPWQARAVARHAALKAKRTPRVADLAARGAAMVLGAGVALAALAACVGG